MPTPITPNVTLPALAGRVRPVNITRAGVTLLELVVVLAVLALSALAVPPLLAPSVRPFIADRDQLVVQARREALRRAERVWLRLAADGAWVIATQQGTEVLFTGQLAMPARVLETPSVTDVTIDALGRCQPGPGSVSPAESAVTFDMLACRWAVPSVQP